MCRRRCRCCLLRLQSDCFDDDAGSPLSLSLCRIHPLVISTAIPFTTASFTAQFILPSAESDQLHLSIHCSEVVKITPKLERQTAQHTVRRRRLPVRETTCLFPVWPSAAGRSNGTSDTSGLEWSGSCNVQFHGISLCNGGKEEVRAR